MSAPILPVDFDRDTGEFFRAAREGSYWEEVAKTSTVALYLPSDGDWAGAEVALYAADAAALR
jgi:hypothetical protein